MTKRSKEKVKNFTQSAIRLASEAITEMEGGDLGEAFASVDMAIADLIVARKELDLALLAKEDKKED